MWYVLFLSSISLLNLLAGKLLSFLCKTVTKESVRGTHRSQVILTTSIEDPAFGLNGIKYANLALQVRL
jgi:hypothetical protein